MQANDNTNKWSKDIEYLKKTLPEKDPNLHAKVDLNAFNSKLDNLKENVDKLSDGEIQIKLSEIIASLGDSHTTIQGGIFDPKEIYPLNLYWINNELYVTGADIKYENLLSCQLIKINNISIDDIASRINSFIPHENNQWLKVENPYYICNVHIL
jgi:hypothetical protein